MVIGAQDGPDGPDAADAPDPQDGPDAPDTPDTATRLRAIGDELSDRFYERADVVRTLLVTLLAGQHSLVLGPPGTAKSELARELTGRFEGAAYWEILLSKFTAPTRMFGPIDVAALARGEYRQVYDGRATTAHIAFIDEIFKCSTAALNETLGYLNERIYHPESGGEPIRRRPLPGDLTVLAGAVRDGRTAGSGSPCCGRPGRRSRRRGRRTGRWSGRVRCGRGPRST